MFSSTILILSWYTWLTFQAAGIAACLGAEPAVILQAAEIGIE
jgi:hypothetical protein